MLVQIIRNKKLWNSNDFLKMYQPVCLFLEFKNPQKIQTYTNRQSKNGNDNVNQQKNQLTPFNQQARDRNMHIFRFDVTFCYYI